MRGMYLLIYLFKAHFKDFLYVDEKVLIFLFQIHESHDQLRRGQPLQGPKSP
jgi:hypothetical protein